MSLNNLIDLTTTDFENSRTVTFLYVMNFIEEMNSKQAPIFKISQFSDQIFLNRLGRAQLSEEDMLIYSRIIKHVEKFAYGETFDDDFIFLIISVNQRLTFLHEDKKSLSFMVAKIITELFDENLGKRNDRRKIIEIIAILFYHKKRNLPIIDSMNLDEFKEKYRNILNPAVEFERVSKTDIQILLLFRNILVVFLNFYRANSNCTNLIDVVTRIVEGHRVKYITGSGQKISTTLRVYIYRTETGTQSRNRKVLRKNPFTSKHDAEIFRRMNEIVKNSEPSNQRDNQKEPINDEPSSQRDNQIELFNDEPSSQRDNQTETINNETKEIEFVRETGTMNETVGELNTQENNLEISDCSSDISEKSNTIDIRSRKRKFANFNLDFKDTVFSKQNSSKQSRCENTSNKTESFIRKIKNRRSEILSMHKGENVYEETKKLTELPDGSKIYEENSTIVNNGVIKKITISYFYPKNS